MKKIEIRYRPITFLPFYLTVTGNFPANWGEINAKQLAAIACIYKGASNDLKFLQTMTGLPMKVLKRTDDYERFKLIEQLEFIGDRKPYHEFIIRRITLDRYAANIFRDTIIYAPEPKLKGVTFAQFIFADTYFSNYQGSQNIEDLNKFIASLYLRKNEPFAEKLIQRNCKYIGRINRSTREAIAINWQLIHEWLSLAYPLIFQKREEIMQDTAVPEREAVEGKVNGSPWIKIFQNFVGDDILHNDEWANMPVNTIFQFMTRKYKENARRKN